MFGGYEAIKSHNLVTFNITPSFLKKKLCER